jgi:hypothetical protein
MKRPEERNLKRKAVLPGGSRFTIPGFGSVAAWGCSYMTETEAEAEGSEGTLAQLSWPSKDGIVVLRTV